jgi:hypothetical protein
MSQNWQDILYNGLTTNSGRAPRVYSAMITKPNVKQQFSEIVAPQLDIVSDNDRMNGLTKPNKQKFSIHRAMSFLPQE